MAAQAAQEGGKARAAANGDHAQGPKQRGIRRSARCDGAGFNEASFEDNEFTECAELKRKTYGISGYSNSVNRGSSTML